MSRCLKTGVDLWSDCYGCMWRTDLHAVGDVFIFTLCTEERRQYDRNREDADIVMNDTDAFYGLNGVCVVPAKDCLVIATRSKE
jgi:hypothetical protein